MNIPELESLTSKQKVEWTFRIIMLTLTGIGGLIAMAVLGYVKSAANTLTQVDKDITQIKFELPIIKNTIAADKIALQLQIEQLQSKGDVNSKEISDLKTEIALLRQKTTS